MHLRRLLVACALSVNLVHSLLASAAAAPAAGTPPDLAWDAPHAANPFLPGYYADPSLVEHEGVFYLYATLDPWGGAELGCWSSRDLRAWTWHRLPDWPTKAACTSPTSGGSQVWAPSVVRGPRGRFHLFVSVGSEVWTGVADHPLGPWKNALGDRPLIPGNFRPGFHMIDAEAFIDEDGTPYLYWGSGWNWVNGRCFAVRLNADLDAFAGEVHDVTPTNYFEAPVMTKHAGRYYLTYSQGRTDRDTYQVHYAVGDTPFGPFTEGATSPILVTDVARHVVSPGHHTIFRHAGRPYLLYHRHEVPFVPGTIHRQLCVDELTFTADAGGSIARVTPTHAGPALIQRRGHGPAPLAATATASSTRDELHGPARVLDDNHATRWAAAPRSASASADSAAPGVRATSAALCAADAADSPWLQLDLGSVQRVARQELRFEYAWHAYACRVEASRDGTSWTTLATAAASAPIGSPYVIDTAAAPVTARYLRLTFAPDTDPATASLWEWQAYAAPSPAP